MPHPKTDPAGVGERQQGDRPAPGTAPPPRRVLAVIPARGGSKGVPGKNLAAVGGVPLVVRAVRACRAARRVTDVVVSTDDAAVADAARAAGAAIVPRPAALAGDTATSEAAVLHALDAHEALHGAGVDTVLLVQCTSPFVSHRDVDRVAAAVGEQGADTALTVAPFHGFVWRDGAGRPDHAERLDAAGVLGVGAGAADAGSDAPGDQGVRGGHRVRGGHGVNHDASFRPRRQDRPQDLLETGAVYGMAAAAFRAHRHRFFGRTALVRTDPARVLEIDDPHDLARARALAPLLASEHPGPYDDGTGPGTSGTPPSTAPQPAPSPHPPRQAHSASTPHQAHPSPATHSTRPTRRPTREDVDAVVLDFDGTQTDDRVLIDSAGRECVAVHRGDGLGIAALRRAGLAVLILSTERNPVVAARADKLRVPVLHGIDRKDIALRQWCDEQGIAPQRVLYAGNDVNDLPCFALVGWPVAVANASGAVRGAARAVTGRPGGAGAVREIAGWLLGPSLAASGHRSDPPPDSPNPFPDSSSQSSGSPDT